MLENIKKAYSFSGTIGAAISALSVFNILAHYFHFGMSSTVRLIMKTYVEIFHDTLLRPLLFFIPFEVQNSTKDVMVIYFIGFGVLLRSLVTVNKQLGPALSLDFDSTGKPVYVADNKKNVKDYLYITSYALCWPVTIMTIWGVTMNRGRRADTRSLPEAMFGPPDIVIGGASMPRSRKPDIVIREVVLFQLSVTAGALIMILAFNAGVGNQEASEVPIRETMRRDRTQHNKVWPVPRLSRKHLMD